MRNKYGKTKEVFMNFVDKIRKEWSFFTWLTIQKLIKKETGLLITVNTLKQYACLYGIKKDYPLEYNKKKKFDKKEYDRKRYIEKMKLIKGKDYLPKKEKVKRVTTKILSDDKYW